MERAQHAGDVAQRRALEPPLAERPRRLALEVDDDEVAAGVEHLAEMVVAVDADARGAPMRSLTSAAVARAELASSPVEHLLAVGRAASGSSAAAAEQR